MSSRYARQIVLPEIGEAGQRLLGKARVLVVGAGGLGSPALLYLTAAGVGLSKQGGCIGMIDDDVVDTSNLQRQILFREPDQGNTKVEAAQKHLSTLNNATQLLTYPHRLNASNALDILDGYDVIIDGSDNFNTKYILNDAATRLGKPIVYGTVIGFEGRVSVFWAQQGPCYRCIYPQAPETLVPNCAEAGTLGGIAGVIGSIQAIEACKLALGLDHCRRFGLEPLIGKLLLFDALTWDVQKLNLDKAAHCPVCTIPANTIVLSDSASAITTCSIKPTGSISLRELENLRHTGRPLRIIDVREASEWAMNHLENAQHIPLNALLNDKETRQSFSTDELLVVYCQHGTRSAHAVSFLRTKGFEALNLILDRSN